MVTLAEVFTGIAIIVLFVGLFANIFGLPGTVVIFLDALVYGTVTGFATVSLKTLGILLLLGLVAEMTEFLMGLSPGLYLGPSVQGFMVALFGAIVGMTILTPKLMVLGTLLGLYFGGFLGVLGVELFHQAKLKPAFRAPATSVAKRIGGKTAKGVLGIMMVAIVLSTIYS